TEQFNPFIQMDEISEYEMALEPVQEAVRNSNVKGLLIRDLGYNSDMEVPFSEYNSDDYDAESYQIMDTIEMKDPSITDFSLRDFIIKSDKIVLVSSQNLNKGEWANIELLKGIFEECKK